MTTIRLSSEQKETVRKASEVLEKTLGRRLSQGEAVAALAEFALRNRQFAAYQRKWMRRIPGLVTVRGDRDADEVADEILALARARERLPAGR